MNLELKVIMDNGILQVYLSNLGGLVTRIQYNGIDNLLEVLSGSEHTLLKNHFLRRTF